jgi:predicted PurR-regulated permease PerM
VRANGWPEVDERAKVEIRAAVPIIVGALLAFLFRPVKERFKIPWLPHELQVLCSFAAIGLVLFFAFNTARKHIPDDQQKLDKLILQEAARGNF